MARSRTLHWIDGRPLLIFFIAVFLVVPMAAGQSEIDDAFTSSDIRDLRRDDEVKPPGVAWFASIGLTHIDAEDGARLWLTPVTLDARLNRNTTVRLEGDGYGRVTADGNTVQGFNNLTLIVSRVVYRDEASRLRMGIGASAPGSSGIGSRGAKQRISASYSRVLDEHWAAAVSGKLTRRNQLRIGEARVEQSGRLQATYTFDETMPGRLLPPALTFQLERRYRRQDAGGLSEATASYDFPLGRHIGASIGLTRGLTRGLRDNTVAFDLLFAF